MTKIFTTILGSGLAGAIFATLLVAPVAAYADNDTETAGIEIERTLLTDPAEYYPLGVETPFATLKVTATNMAGATQIWMGGKHRSSFIADLEEIPAGTGEYTINITFVPTVAGRNEAMINFDASPTELSQSISVAALAYDPENMPSFTVEESTVEPFSAAVGSTQEQTLTISAENLLDYGNIRVLGLGDGAFRISSGTFLKNGPTQLRITFAPTAEGTFNETIEFSSPKANTITVNITGTTTGDQQQEEKEGDELSFDISAPMAQYSTDFSDAGDSNKPLKLNGWKNVAIDGTRAFWSYVSDGNTMAKVTAYDSKMSVSDSEPAEMLLLSPALDYVNSPTRLLQFRIMGENLTDGMTDRFSVLYINPSLPEEERYQVITGIDIPASADGAGSWREFILDLDDLDLADTFFIGFHYLSNRGRNTSTVYYVDDFAWGSTSTPFIRIDKQQAVTTAEVGETVIIDEFNVIGLSLTEQISIAFEGADKEQFILSETSLPADGGKFTVSYAPKAEGQHAVYVTLRSAGAPDTYLTVGGTATPQSGIGAIEASETCGNAVYYDLQGRPITRPSAGSILIRIAPGTRPAKIRH